MTNLTARQQYKLAALPAVAERLFTEDNVHFMVEHNLDLYNAISEHCSRIADAMVADDEHQDFVTSAESFVGSILGKNVEFSQFFDDDQLECYPVVYGGNCLCGVRPVDKAVKEGLQDIHETGGRVYIWDKNFELHVVKVNGESHFVLFECSNP